MDHTVDSTSERPFLQKVLFSPCCSTSVTSLLRPQEAISSFQLAAVTTLSSSRVLQYYIIKHSSCTILLSRIVQFYNTTFSSSTVVHNYILKKFSYTILHSEVVQLENTTFSSTLVIQ